MHAVNNEIAAARELARNILMPVADVEGMQVNGILVCFCIAILRWYGRLRGIQMRRYVVFSDRNRPVRFREHVLAFQMQRLGADGDVKTIVSCF